MTKNSRYRVEISSEQDVATAVYAAQDLSQAMGFDKTARSMIATAVSELARNIFLYAGSGEILLRQVSAGRKKVFEVIAQDTGPGIKDITQALEEGYSTGKTLGLGLPGVKRLMDEFVFDSERRTGTKIMARKWLP